MSLTICTWLWGDKYGPEDVKKLSAGIRRHLKQPYRFVCFSESRLEIDGVERGPLPDVQLTKVPGCFARLRMFDPSWQREWFSDRLVCIDLDTVITGPLDPLFNRPEPFVILQGGNAANPCKFGGALMMLRPGVHPEIWQDFTIKAASDVPFYKFPDDQGWIWHKAPDAAGWKCGADSGVYVFRKPGWPTWGDYLPSDALMVTFNGWRSPEKFKQFDWIKTHWRA